MMRTILFCICFVATFSLSSREQIDCVLKPLIRETTQTGRSSSTAIRNTTAASSNWSGYVAASNLAHPTAGSVSAVAGSWTIPLLHYTPDTSYSAAWVGIDGYSNGTVEQIGTEQTWVNGRQQNYAWFEMYPQGAYQILGFPVNPGDLIYASVSYVGNSNFQLVIENLTKQVYFTVPSFYTRSTTAQRSSAEWIMEAPSSNTGILPLANFGSTSFVNCVASINNIPSVISNTHWQNEAIDMISGRVTKALPSSLYGGGQDFIMTWYHE